MALYNEKGTEFPTIEAWIADENRGEQLWTSEGENITEKAWNIAGKKEHAKIDEIEAQLRKALQAVADKSKEVVEEVKKIDADETLTKITTAAGKGTKIVVETAKDATGKIHTKITEISEEPEVKSATEKVANKTGAAVNKTKSIFASIVKGFKSGYNGKNEE
ncbi:MAG: hypothetical protein LBN08_02735 [Lactobacillales bacterium]|nr:hypothetical protein [Lactobacillales bacterium]